MQTIETGVLIGICGILLSALAYFAGTKKANRDEGQQKGYFEGTVTAKLDELGKKIDKFEDKLSRNSKDFYNAIDEEIKNHETRYHHNGE